MSKKFESVVVFTDGACSGNPGPGGWGSVIATPEGFIKELGGAVDNTTNNRMEILAVLSALNYVSKNKGLQSYPIDIYTDSTYVIRGITQWIWGWIKKGWLTAEGEPVSNQDLWLDLSAVVSKQNKKSKINWHYSRGHVGTPGNERCDEIAVHFSKKKWVDLYEGSLLQYPISIYDLPEDTSLPEIKEKIEKKPAYSYLSYLSGEVWRHSDWASCERRVKGRSGAKFKKATSAHNEQEILKEWGLSETTKIKN